MGGVSLSEPDPSDKCMLIAFWLLANYSYFLGFKKKLTFCVDCWAAYFFPHTGEKGGAGGAGFGTDVIGRI